MNYSIKNILCLLVIGSILLNASIKDKPFIQEYHVPFPLETVRQNNVNTIVVDNDNQV